MLVSTPDGTKLLVRPAMCSTPRRALLTPAKLTRANEAGRADVR